MKTSQHAIRSEILMFRLTAAQRHNLEIVAQQLDLSVSEVIRVALGEYIARQMLMPFRGEERPALPRRLDEAV